MPNLTVTVNADLLRAAKIYAAQQGTSISRIVRQHLAELVGQQARLADDDVLARFAQDRIGRQEAMRALGVDYGTLLELLAARGLALPRVPDQQADAMAATFAKVWRGAGED